MRGHAPSSFCSFLRKNGEPPRRDRLETLGEPIKSVKTAWKATCRRAGITGLHLNDLRHEFGCRLLESGSGLHDVRDFLGHANITTTSRYLQSSSHRLADALTRMEPHQRQGFSVKVAQTSHKVLTSRTPA